MKTTKYITRAAIILALTIALQFAIREFIPSVPPFNIVNLFVVGSIVNLGTAARYRNDRHLGGHHHCSDSSGDRMAAAAPAFTGHDTCCHGGQRCTRCRVLAGHTQKQRIFVMDALGRSSGRAAAKMVVPVLYGRRRLSARVSSLPAPRACRSL